MANSNNTQSQSSLTKLMVTFVTVSTLIFIAILLLIITPKINNIFSEFKQQSQNDSTAIFASQLNQYIKDRELATKDITSNDSLTRALLAHNSADPAFRDYLNHILLLGEDANFTVLDVTGAVFYSEANHNNYTWAKPILESEVPQLVKITRYNDKPYFEIATPIYYGNSKEGILISQIDASPAVVLGEKVTDSNDTDIIYQANNVMVKMTEALIEKPVVSQKKLVDYPITLTYITSEKDLDNSKFELLASVLTSALIGIFLAFLLQLWIGKKLLSEPFKKLALTEKNLSQSVSDLQEANSFQELINASTPDLIFVKDSKLNIVKANPNFLQLYPSEIRDSVIGINSIEASHDKAEAEDFHEMDRKAFTDGYSETIEVINFPNGQVKSLYTQKIRFENRKKEAFILGIARDVTESEREASLLNQLSQITADNTQTSDEKIQSALQSSLSYFDLSLAIVSHISDETYTIVHTTAEEDELKPGDQFAFNETYCSFVYNKKGVQAWHDAGGSIIATHPCYSKFKLETYIGTNIYVDNIAYGTLNFTSQEKRTKPFSEREKTFINTIAQWIGYQLSSQKSLEKKEAIIKQLTQSNEQLEQFAYICSHDLQEPLRMVGSFSELLNSHLASTGHMDDKSQRYLGFLLDGAHRAKTLIHDILNYSKLDKDTVKPELVELSELIEQIKQAAQSQPAEQQALIEYTNLPTVKGNKTQLYQLFQNLINNGIKYQPASNQPIIKLSASHHEDQWSFSVVDNGIGIEKQHHSKIFDIFKRLHGRNEYAGTGIGLSICKKIVEGHGGKIWVESNPGEGCNFRFTLPDNDQTTS